MPRLRSTTKAFSMSPLASWRALRQSPMGAPDFSRSSLTCLASIFTASDISFPLVHSFDEFVEFFAVGRFVVRCRTCERHCFHGHRLPACGVAEVSPLDKQQNNDCRYRNTASKEHLHGCHGSLLAQLYVAPSALGRLIPVYLGLRPRLV